MLGRIGFLGRVMLIVLALLFAFVALSIALSLAGRERGTVGNERFPLPAQAAAIVELLDTTPKSRHANVLKAVNSETFRVAIQASPPGNIAVGDLMPGLAWLVGQYLEKLDGRDVLAFRLSPPGRPIVRLIERLTGSASTPIAIAVNLADDRYVVFEVRGDGTRRLFGIPVGFWIGVFGALFAALALWAIAREARPLRELSEAVQHFAADGSPHPVQTRGAPEISALIQAINDMQKRIASLIKGRTVLLGAVSHDLKTFITRLRLRVEDIADEAQRDKAVADLESMTGLVDSAIAVARGAAPPEHRKPVDLAALLHRVATEQSSDRVTVALDAALSQASVSGDEVALRRLFDNLVANALRYGTRCQISSARPDGAIVIDIDDDGPGIPEGEHLAVFEPFYRIEASRSRSTGGSGLGLAIVKQIADAHGISIEIGRSPFGGSRFRLRLPLNP